VAELLGAEKVTSTDSTFPDRLIILFGMPEEEKVTFTDVRIGMIERDDDRAERVQSTATYSSVTALRFSEHDARAWPDLMEIIERRVTQERIDPITGYGM
jgi:hypothetical protein